MYRLRHGGQDGGDVVYVDEVLDVVLLVIVVEFVLLVEFLGWWRVRWPPSRYVRRDGRDRTGLPRPDPQGRESQGLSQEELAKQLNEKASLIRKLEQGNSLPSDDVQKKLESALEISLSAGGSADETEWSGGSSDGEYTLGDVVKRKD